MILAAAVVAPPLAAQVPSPPPAAAPVEDLVKVALDTPDGRIVIALDRGRAPVTTANFLHYVDSGRFNGISFYRAMPYGSGGLLQAGITRDSSKLYPPIAHEPTAKTGIHHVAGTVSMAAFAPGQARSDFFILTSDIPSFDSSAAGNDGFAAFGHVVEGMEVVKKIFASPVSPTRGDGPMKGQMLEPAVPIIRAARVE